jgi:hypothetical protein
MCTFDILASSPQGYIARCNQCRNLEIAFGTSLAFLPDRRLEDFLFYIRDMLPDANQVNPTQKKIILNLASTEALQMILTPSELHQLFDLLDRALDEMRARSILNLFNA